MFGEYLGFSIYNERMERNSPRPISFPFLFSAVQSLLGSLRDHWQCYRAWQVLTNIKASFQAGREILSGVSLERCKLGEFVAFRLWFTGVGEASSLFSHYPGDRTRASTTMPTSFSSPCVCPRHTDTKVSSTVFLWILVPTLTSTRVTQASNLSARTSLASANSVSRDCQTFSFLKNLLVLD